MQNVKSIEGELIARGARFGIVLARFNGFIGERLLDGALDTLMRHGVEASQIEVVRVPGAFEVPLTLKTLAVSKKYDALIALGAVIRGETFHFEIVSNESAAGVNQVQLDTGVPVANGILTTDTDAQAEARAPVKGRDCAEVAVEMANALRAIERHHK